MFPHKYFQLELYFLKLYPGEPIGNIFFENKLPLKWLPTYIRAIEQVSLGFPGNICME
jgi:hypothetical protein